MFGDKGELIYFAVKENKFWDVLCTFFEPGKLKIGRRRVNILEHSIIMQILRIRIS